jgi:flagellar basal body P-ring formation protein FlgA
VKPPFLSRSVPALALALAAAAFAPHAAAQTLAAADAEPAAATAPAATYPVAARDLARGEVLAAEDIDRVALSEDVAKRADGATVSLVGWRTRRVISAGEPLRPPAVSPPDLVRAGEPVEAVWQGRSVVLRVSGTAAGSAAMGERVLVRIDARRRLEGVVIGPALVQLESNESR